MPTKRESLLNSNPPKHIDVETAPGDIVRVMQPSLAQVSQISSAAEKSSADSVVAVCTLCVIDPDTNAPVFKPTDAERLREMPLDGWVAKVMDAFKKLTNREAVESEGKGVPPTAAVG